MMAAFKEPFNFADPPVKITGSVDAVSMAADSIRSELDPLDNPNRVSLKMEVSWTEHSHIIGREGRSIKSVSTVTNCHIHFPDSNRFSETEKCNQVSIAGDPQAVETARAQVRNLSPIIFAFEIPFSTDTQAILESRQSPEMQYIQTAYGVQIIVRNKGRPGTVALVKGNSWELDKVKTATRALMQHLCRGETEVMMYLEISPHYHSTVLGSNGASHVRAIMAVTGTMIVWPNLADTSLHPLRKSTFVISGQIDKVYIAREMLIGSLPLILMSDLPQGLELEMEQVQLIMTTMKVTVSTRPKNKNGVLHRTLVIRGTERHVDRLYEARRILLGIPADQRINVYVPESYHVPPVPPSVPLQQPLMHSVPLMSMPGAPGRFSPEPSVAEGAGLLGWYPPTTFAPGPPQSPYMHPFQYPFLTPTHGDGSKIYPGMNSWMYPDRRQAPGTPRPFSLHGNNANDWNNFNREKHNSSFLNSTAGTDASASNSLSSSSYSLFSASSGSAASSASPSHHNTGGRAGPSGKMINLMDAAGGSQMHDMMHGGHEVGTVDYNTRKVLASRAMAQEVHPDVPRTPTTAWSGMGFSKSHSAALLSTLNRSSLGMGYTPNTSVNSCIEEKNEGNNKETGNYNMHQSTPRQGCNMEENENKVPGSPQKDMRGGNVRMPSNSGSLSSIGSMASSQQTLVSPSFADRASMAEWRSSWSDFETEDSSIIESLFLNNKPSIGSYGSPEKKPVDGSGLSSGLAGLSLADKRKLDSNNNNDSSGKGLNGGVSGAGATSAAESSCVTVLTSRPQTTSQISFSSSNVIDGVVPLPRPITSGYNDLYEVLAKLNLSKYIEVFQGQDIDLSTFLTLTEGDLARLGISTFGARRKILVAIQELSKQGPVFSGSAAVGAERRPSNL